MIRKSTSFLVLLAALLLLGLSRPGVKPPLQPVDLELVLAVDVSGSVDDEEAKLQRKGYVDAFRSAAVVRAIRSGRHKRIAVTYIEWAGYNFQYPMVGWTLVHDRASARAFSDKLAQVPIRSGPYTSISGIIDYALPLFYKNGFQAHRQVIDISGDGPNNSGRSVTEARAEAIRKGVTINGLPIMNDRPSPWGRAPMPNLDLYYRRCVIGGRRAILVVAEGFRSFARAIRRKLILEIVGITPGDLPVPQARIQAAASRGLRGPRVAPPCNAGERRRRSWFEDFDF